LNFKINKFLKTKNIDEKLKKLIYYSFPSVSDLKLKNNEFLYDRNFVTFLINSLLSFFYSGDRLLIDNDFLSYYKINFKISKNEDEDKLSDKNSNLSSINQSPYIIDILLDKMSFLKYAPSDILVSFGANKLNQTSHDNYDMLTLPRLVYKLSDLKIKKIFSGHNYNLVIDNKNEVYSWGDNSRGQCGHCDKIVIKSPKQVFFPELCENDYIENICCGKNCTYFISFNKKIFLCGYNLIINKIWYNPTLLELNFDSNISQIKSGDDFTLFLTEKGNLYSMGFGSHGQLGISNLITEYNNKKYCQKPTKILNSIKSISCGAYYAFAISYNSEIFCWGDNSQGQLGLNNKSYNGNNMINYEQDKNNILTPEKLDGLEEFEIKNIQCGKNFTFFQKKNNDLLGCGDNSKEQLGISMNTNINNEIYIPTEIEQFSFLVVNRISCGDEHSMAIIKDNTSDLVNIWCWGSNEYGQLGLGCHVMNSKPKPNHYLLEFINHKPIDISTGSFHTIILLQRKDFNPNNNDETLIKLIFDNSKI
jgi:alpha-tubulin suppressor-like RCC1 family protein